MRKILFFLSISFSLFVINNVAHSIYDIWQKHELVDVEQQTLQKDKEENTRLKRTLALVQSQSFIEEEARNKLQLLKPKEEQIILPEQADPTPVSSQTTVESKNHLQEWVHLFLDF